MGTCWITSLWSLTKAIVIYQLSEISACHGALDDRDPQLYSGSVCESCGGKHPCHICVRKDRSLYYHHSHFRELVRDATASRGISLGFSPDTSGESLHRVTFIDMEQIHSQSSESTTERFQELTAKIRNGWCYWLTYTIEVSSAHQDQNTVNVMKYYYNKYIVLNYYWSKLYFQYRYSSLTWFSEIIIWNIYDYYQCRDAWYFCDAFYISGSTD